MPRISSLLLAKSLFFFISLKSPFNPIEAKGRLYSLCIRPGLGAITYNLSPRSNASSTECVIRIIVFPSIWWGYSPPLIYTTFTEDPLNNLKMFLLPSLVLGMSLAGGTMRLTRTMMLEVLKQEYVRTAYSKGLKEKTVIMRHAFRNSLIPVVTSIGPELFLMIGGSVIIEQIFSLPGIGRLTIQAIQTRDYPVISGVLLIFSIALIFINLLIDLSYAYLDPRIRYK